MNKFRNEKLVKLGDAEILLRPSFKKIAQTEFKLGSIAGIAIQVSSDDKAKSQFPISMMAEIFFINQVEEKYSLDQIFDLVLEEGYQSCRAQVLEFLVLITAGRKVNEQLQQEQQEKKV